MHSCGAKQQKRAAQWQSHHDGSGGDSSGGDGSSLGAGLSKAHVIAAVLGALPSRDSKNGAGRTDGLFVDDDLAEHLVGELRARQDSSPRWSSKNLSKIMHFRYNLF